MTELKGSLNPSSLRVDMQALRADLDASLKRIEKLEDKHTKQCNCNLKAEELKAEKGGKMYIAVKKPTILRIVKSTNRRTNIGQS